MTMVALTTLCAIGTTSLRAAEPDPSDPVRKHWFVSGRVQGVGFRYFVEDVAADERLGGWVRNLRDGRVEALVEGEAQAVDRFERKLRSGPPAARVDNVEVEEREPSGRATAFRVEPSA